MAGLLSPLWDQWGAERNTQRLLLPEKIASNWLLFLPIVSKSYRVLGAIFVALCQTFRLRSVRTNRMKVHPTRNCPSDGASVFRFRSAGHIWTISDFEKIKISSPLFSPLVTLRKFKVKVPEVNYRVFSFSLLFKWIEFKFGFEYEINWILMIKMLTDITIFNKLISR